MDIDINALFASPWGALLIFCLRIVDVSCDTMRVLFTVRGKRAIAGLLGFFQALIWIFAVGSAIKFLDSWLHVLGYGSHGNLGNLGVRVFFVISGFLITGLLLKGPNIAQDVCSF